MKKVGIIVFILMVIGSGIYLIRSMRYYAGSGLAKQVAAMRQQKQEGEQKAVERQKKKTVDIEIELKKFYGTVELTAEQKTYAEETIRIMQQEMLPYRQELAQLTRTTRQTMIASLELSDPAFKKLPPEKIYQTLQDQNSLNDSQKTTLDSLYNDYRTKRKELNHGLNLVRQAGNKALLNLLTEEQKKIYLQEHPPKKSS